MADAGKLTVFYDGSCPLCNREASFYRRRKGAESISWIDVSCFAAGEVAPGLSRHQALACFHVLYADGVLVSGSEAIVELWAALPGFRLLGRFVKGVFPADQTRGAGAVPSRPIGDLRSDHAEDHGNVPLEGDSAKFAAQRNFLVRSIARLRPRAAR